MRFTEPLKQNRDFKRLYARGKSAASAFLVVYCRKTRGNKNRLGITVGVKIGNAVIRNRMRRRIKEAYRLGEGVFLPGYDIVVVARFRAVGASFETLCCELSGLFDRLGMLDKK